MCPKIQKMGIIPLTLSVFLYTSPFQFFSEVELKFCRMSDNVKVFLKWQLFVEIYVGVILFRKFHG